jgi:four helix bundle protein
MRRNMTSRLTPRQIEDRLVEYAVGIARLANMLPRSPLGRHIASQTIRSGTAPAAHYAEACAAESTRDFTHKLALALKELRETRVWLLITHRAGLTTQDVSELIDESEQLIRIVAKSIVTARSRREKR